METPRLVKIIRRHGHWFKAADKILNTMFAAREGGRLAMALAGASAVGTIIDTAFPDPSGWDILLGLGLRDADMTIGGFLCDLMRKRDHQVVAATIYGSVTFLWRDAKGEPLAGAIYNSGQFSDGPFIHADRIEDFYEAAREVAWAKGSELRLTVTRDGNTTWRASHRFHLDPLQPLGPYLGRQRPEDYAARLAKYPPGPRTVILRGPTGVGKSVLARHVARLRGGREARVLKVSSEVLRHCRSDEVVGLIQCLQPTVLLIDDMQIDQSSDFLLDLLEALRDPRTLTFVTVMTKFAETETLKPGIWYTPGMRPGGRVDEFWSFGPPDSEDRAIILDHYAREHGLRIKRKRREKLIERTAGLTGAYLGNLVLRLATFGIDSWESELNAILYTAPFATESDEKAAPPAPPKG